MKAVVQGNRKSLTPALTRRLWRSVFVFAMLCTAVFWFTVSRVTRDVQQRSIDRESRLCAAVLVPGENGDLSESVARLQERFDGLIAVATLDSVGNVSSVYPERTAHRRAVQTAFASSPNLVSVSSPTSGESSLVRGVVVPLNGVPSSVTRQVMLLLRVDPALDRVGPATLVFALIVCLAGFCCVASIRYWFEHEVSRPLRRMGSITKGPLGIRRHRKSSAWSETEDIAERFEELVEDIETVRAASQRIERDSAVRLRQQEQGYDVKLRRARDRATLDPLTRLRNRRFLDEDLEPFVETCRGQSRTLSAVMVDMDNFKNYNDTHGHMVGDALLRFVGALLRGAIRPADHAIRYGGDEFLLILVDADGLEATAIADRILKLFRQYTKRLGHTHELSLSAGVSTALPESRISCGDLINGADRALYKAKHSGKGTVKRLQETPQSTDDARNGKFIPCP